MDQSTTIRKLTESALMIALAFVLDLIAIELPFGGSFTLFSQLPIIILAYRYGTKWGLSCAFVFSLSQMLMGISNFGYVKGFAAWAIVALCDYIIAFTVLGLGGVFKGKIKNQGISIACGAVFVSMLRFICHFISGVTVWREYAGEKAAWLYSLNYNGSYMLVEALMCAVGAILLCLVLDFTSPDLRKKTAI